MLARTSDNLVRAQFSSKKVSKVLDLHSYGASDSLKHQLELKSPISTSMLDKKDQQKIKYSKTDQTRPFLGFTKKSSTLLRVVWAEESKTGQTRPFLVLTTKSYIDSCSLG